MVASFLEEIPVMRLASFLHSGREGFGPVVADHVVNMATDVPTLRDALTLWGSDGLVARARSASGPRIPLADIAWLPPVTNPDKCICVGLNFYEHAKEAKMAVPSNPSLFVRFPSSQVGQGVPVVRPRASHQFDYEAELAVVIGKRGRHVTEAQAQDYVFGYACFAENSVRDWQMHGRQATAGKNFFATGAFGPWIVTPDEAGPVEKMDVIGRLNGRELQRDSGANMIFSVARTIAYVTTFTELLPGDVLVMGTPAGVGFTRDPPLWLVPGDRFEVEITGVGTLSNPIVDESEA